MLANSALSVTPADPPGEPLPRRALDSLLRPRTIAVIGATPNFEKVNGRLLKHLIDKGFQGRLFPVNPNYSRIGSLTCYPSIAAVPEVVDLALVAVPAREVPGAILALGERGVRTAVVIGSGFAESGDAGRELEEQLARAIGKSEIRVCGPNCLGFVNAFDNVVASFSQYAEGRTEPGPVGFVSQSGAFGTAIASLARMRGINFGYFFSTGNESDIGLAELMLEVIKDSRVRVGAGYLEGLRDGAKLIELARHALEIGKPIVLVIAGRSAAGAKAASSHTGTLAVDAAVFDGVAEQFGIVRARNEEHMLDIVDTLTNCALPAGLGVGLITLSGGAGVLMADRAAAVGLRVPVLGVDTQNSLKSLLPEFAAIANPVDITAQFVAEPERLRDVVLLTLDDPAVDVGIVWIQLMERHADSLCRALAEARLAASKPFVVCWVAAPESAVRTLRGLGLAVLRGAEPAVDGVAALAHYAHARREWFARAEDPVPQRDLPPLPPQEGSIATVAAVSLLGQMGITHARCAFATSQEEAISAARSIGFPVALKIESADIPHKTDVRGVRLNLRNSRSVRKAFRELYASVAKLRPTARINGITVHEMVTGNIEMAVGLHNDPTFGMLVMVGSGGVHLEVFGDVTFRKAPVNTRQALAMIDGLRVRAMFDGFRGTTRIERTRFAEFVAAVSLFGHAASSRLQELDLNPVLVRADGAIAVDCVMVLGPPIDKRTSET